MKGEDYISFEIAKLLKKNEVLNETDAINEGWLYSMYDENGNIHWGIYDQNWYPHLTHQAAMKWLREVHHVCITIYPDKTKGYEAVLYDTKDNVEIILQSFGVYGSHIFRDSYEEAIEAALKYSLENLI